jgi:hypothetical protein
MSREPSLADTAVTTLANIQSLDLLIDGKHPLRHSIHSMKMLAEKMLSDAMYNATELTWKAKTIVRDFDRSMDGKDVKEAT